MMRTSLAPTLAAILLATSTQAADFRRGDRIEIASVQQVIDGDTIRTTVKGDQVNVRFHGIDAPEYDQKCGTVACGRLATQHLVELIGGTPTACASNRMHGFCLRHSRPVTCTITDTDTTPGRPIRPVAICLSGTVNLNERMVADGYAFAYAKYSRDYLPLFALARQNQRGLHGVGALTEADSPAAYRKAR